MPHQLLHANAIPPKYNYKAQVILAPSLNENILSHHKSRPSILAPLLNDNPLPHQYNLKSTAILAPSLVNHNVFKPHRSPKVVSAQRGHRSYGSQLLELEKATSMGKTDKSSRDQASKHSEVASHVDYQDRDMHPPINN